VFSCFKNRNANIGVSLEKTAVHGYVLIFQYFRQFIFKPKENFMKRQLLISAILVFTFSFSEPGNAQCIDCGSGSDGAYSATINTNLPGGIYNYTSFYIAPGVKVSVTGTAPLIINSTGNVDIQGTLSASGGNGSDGITFSTFGVGGVGVAGGANGGDGVYLGSPSPGSNGFGPGAGTGGGGWSGGGGAGYATMGSSSGGGGGFGGPVYGNTIIAPAMGGSGGGGGSGGNSCGSGGGGAGGGIIIISSCGNINIGASGIIESNGGNGGSDGTGNCGGGGGGSGGVIFLTADTTNNSGTITATGGTGGASTVGGSPYFGTGANGAVGRIRFDHMVFTGAGTVNPPAGYIGQPLAAAISTQINLACNGDSSGTATVAATGGIPPYSYSWNPSTQNTATAVNLPAGNYTVTVTDSIGASCTASVTLTEPPAILMSVTLGIVICEGSCANLLSTPTGGNGPPYTFLWTPGSITTPSALVCPDSTTTYTCTVWDSQGCSVSASTTVTVNPAPALTLTAQNDTACVNWSTDVLTGTPAGGTHFGFAVTGNIFNPSFAGAGIHDVYYTYTDTIGCSDTISISIYVDACAGIESLYAEQLNVFPNPASGSIQIHALSSIRYMELINVTGEIIYSSFVNNEKAVVNTASFAEGIYLLRIRIDEGFINRSIIVKR
jgi:hypothetical protein